MDNITDVSIIYYRDINIQIHWNEHHQHIFVQQDGMCIVLPDMTIKDVIYSLGFHDNNIVVKWAKKYNLNVLDTLVSKAHKNIIVISPHRPSCILDNSDMNDSTNDSINDSKNDIINEEGCLKRYMHDGCIRSIIKKLNNNMM